MCAILLGRNNRAGTGSIGYVARILIVDDHRANRDALSALLESAGHDVRTAGDGNQALNLAREQRPELVISDVLMPVMDGYELTRRLKIQFPDSRMRIVALSGYGQPSDRERAAKAGFDDYLVKPVEPGRLSTFLRSLQR